MKIGRTVGYNIFPIVLSCLRIAKSVGRAIVVSSALSQVNSQEVLTVCAHCDLLLDLCMVEARTLLYESDVWILYCT